MMNRKKTKPAFRIPVFYICLVVFVALVLVAMACGLAYLRVILTDYEASQPKYAAEEVFAEYFAEPDFAALVEMCELPENVSPLETKVGFAAELTERYASLPTSYAATTAGADGSLRYLVKAGEQKIAVFSLTVAEEKSEFGFDLYEKGEISLYIRPEESVTISAPAGNAVYVNGTLLDEHYIIEDGIKTDSCAHMPEGVEGITYTTYAVDSLLRVPTVEVKAPDGTAAPLAEDPETGVLTAEIVYDEALADQYSEKMITVAQNYAAFVMRDAWFSSFSGYFDQTTDLYQTIRQVPTSFVWAHDGFSFEDVSATEFYAYDENTFSCRIRFVHLLHRNGREDYTEQFDVTFYLRRVNGEFLIYDMVNN
ncbi:MAG: hypothetical protein IJF49_03720 [Clostridia bacterium]|nr:hypothetical protein [Clostridia bacterium]